MKAWDLVQLDSLRRQYEAMRRLEGLTAQQRGQQLNELVAALMRCYRIRARANNRASTGEIDVAFRIENERFVMENKWEAAPVSEDPIIKLRNRVRRRLAGTIGVFLSISGYTQPALNGIREDGRLDVILIDEEHLKLMLHEIVDPATCLAISWITLTSLERLVPACVRRTSVVLRLLTGLTLNPQRQAMHSDR